MTFLFKSYFFSLQIAQARMSSPGYENGTWSERIYGSFLHLRLFHIVSLS